MPRNKTKTAREAVARVAYELYLRRGGEDGHDIEDWLTAEQMLKEKLRQRGNNSRRPWASRRVEDKSRR